MTSNARDRADGSTDPRAPRDDPGTAELRGAHDVLAEVYAERLAGLLDEMPLERGVLGAFCDLVVAAAGPGAPVGDIGCGTGRLAPFRAAHGVRPSGVDLSPRMVEVARREQPGVEFAVGDLRALPFGEEQLAGAVCWYSLMYLTPADRPGAFAELARVVRPGGYVAVAHKAGDDTLRRGGESLGLGIGFDIYWHSREELERRFVTAEFETVFWGGRPADPDEPQPQGYLIVRRT